MLLRSKVGQHLLLISLLVILSSLTTRTLITMGSVCSAAFHPQPTTTTARNPSLLQAKKEESYYHMPPNGVDYENNRSVFGKILRGELPAAILAESNTLLSFQDRSPAAPLHALIIPKTFIRSVFDLKPSTREVDGGSHTLLLLNEMKTMGKELVKEHQLEAFENGDYKLCFHVPPFTSVNHLHLHVIAPTCQIHSIYQHIKFDTHFYWAADIDDTISNLQQGGDQ